MTKIIFAIALAATSIASACKVSQAGMSFNVMTAVTQEAYQTMDSGSSFKAIYKEKDNNYYTVEKLNEDGICSAQLYNAYFDTLECNSKVIAIMTFLPIPCK